MIHQLPQFSSESSIPHQREPMFAMSWNFLSVHICDMNSILRNLGWWEWRLSCIIEDLIITDWLLVAGATETGRLWRCRWRRGSWPSWWPAGTTTTTTSTTSSIKTNTRGETTRRRGKFLLRFSTQHSHIIQYLQRVALINCCWAGVLVTLHTILNEFVGL